MSSRSLSDFGIVGCECAAAAHFLPSSCPIAPLWGGESGKNWPRRGAFSLSTPKARQAPSAKLLIVCHCEHEHGKVIRIISARKATKRESAFYQGG
ncbi:MAG: BrnT family toxin [Burkholderiaceae bacterium]|nr:BrnT family toxin [Burkholderiaceae bacterium]